MFCFGQQRCNSLQVVKHYCSKLRSFRSQSFPVEWALCHFELAKAFSTRHSSDRLNDLGDALFHPHTCTNVQPPQFALQASSWLYVTLKTFLPGLRSEERLDGKECIGTCSSMG